MSKEKLSQGVLLTLDNAMSMLEQTKDKLPFKVWYGLNKNRKAMESYLKIVKESREKLLLEYVELEEDGKSFKTIQEGNAITFKFKDDSSRESFDKEMTPILEEEVEVDIYKLDINDFESISTNLRDQPLLGVIIEYLLN